MKKKTKFYFAIILLLILGFSIVLPLTIDDKLPISESHFYMYLIVKIFVGLALLFTLIYAVANKKDYTPSIMVVFATMLLQFLPLVIRLVLDVKTPSVIWATIVSFVVIIIYVIFVLYTDILKDKLNYAAEKLEGNKSEDAILKREKKVIKVDDESSYYDENGKFKGAK
jgi:putative effector of murein hydrolase LrgA (UPF0299 family)